MPIAPRPRSQSKTAAVTALQSGASPLPVTRRAEGGVEETAFRINGGLLLYNTGKSFAFPSWILIHNPWVERLKSTLGILMWFVVSTVIAYHIGILDQNPMLGTRNFSLCNTPLFQAYPGCK